MLTPLYIGLVCNLCPVDIATPEIQPTVVTATAANNISNHQPLILEQVTASPNPESVQELNPDESPENLEYKPVEYKKLSADTSILDWSFVKENVEPLNGQFLDIKQDTPSFSSELIQDLNLAKSSENLEPQPVEPKRVSTAKTTDIKAIDLDVVEESIELSNTEEDLSLNPESAQDSNLTKNLENLEYKPVEYKKLSADTSVLDWSFVKENVEPLSVKPLDIQPLKIEEDASSLSSELMQDLNSTENTENLDTQPVESQTISIAEPTSPSVIDSPVVEESIVEQASEPFTILPLGVNIGTRNALESALVKGYEDGTQAVDLDRWLIPFNDIVSAFNLKAQPLESGELELCSPYVAKVINPEEFAVDSELDMAISVGQIETLFDTTTEFSLEEYALILNPPWLNKRAPKDRRLNTFQREISLAGLPEAKPPVFSFTTIGQRTNFTGSGDETDSSGELVGIGSTKSDLTLGFDTNDDGDRLLSVGWEYEPGQRTKDNRVPWRFGVGYGIGSPGQGINASVATGLIPGLELQARYDSVSLSSNESRFSLNLSPSLFLQPKLRPGSRNMENLRTQGGLYIQPFLDRNGNGKKDKEEEYYNEDLDFLLLLNERPLDRYTISKPDIRKDGLLANLFPGKYRLDLDPAGYPVGWKATETAYTLNISAGSYTTVTVPLIPSYILAGTATHNNDEVISGARVEAVSIETGLKYFTVTNGVGSFYLENLPQGNYELLINGNSVSSGKITLNEQSETFQEINLQIN